MNAYDRTGGQAIPTPGFAGQNGETYWPEMGQSMLDAFAIALLGGVATGEHLWKADPKYVAKKCYDFAEAMVAEKLKREHEINEQCEAHAALHRK